MNEEIFYRQKWDELRIAKMHDDLAKSYALNDLDILRRSCFALLFAFGIQLPEDAGAKTIAKAMREVYGGVLSERSENE